MRKPIKAIGILLSAVMTAGMFTALPFSADAASSVQYIDRTWDSAQAKIVETTQTRSGCTALGSGTTVLSGGWYVLNGNVKLSKELKVLGNANLIPCNGYTLNSRYGIFVEHGKTLTIYGQSGDKGKIDVYNPDGAGIGAWDGQIGGSVVIKGGNIKAEGGGKDAGIGGAKGSDSGFDGVTIYGGEITAVSGGRAAAIGSGQKNNEENCGAINIYGGKITAEGNHYGAGIGGGEDCNGGTVTIYGGEDSHVGTLTINGGTIKAIAGEEPAAIGAGYHHDLDSEINISDATIYAVSHLGAAIGAGSGDRENHSGENNKPIRITDSKIYAAAGRLTDSLLPTEKNIDNYDFESLTKDKILNMNQAKNGAAAIGAGRGGSQDGTIYISGSSEVYAHSGGKEMPGAGIGGGAESKLDNGGGSSDIDLSGLTTGFVDAYGPKGSDGKGDAIGAGAGDSRRCTLSIPDNYCVYCYDNSTYAASGKRSSVCQKNRHVLVKPCEHPNDQAYYTLEDNTKDQEHTKHCGYCLYSGTESHSGNPCVCGVENGLCYVTLHSGGNIRVLVPIGKKFILPEGSDYVAGNYYRLFDGWDYNGQILQPGNSITPQSDIMVKSRMVEAFDVTAAANLENGTVCTDKSIAAVGETVYVDPEPDTGYSVSSVTVSGTVYDENNQASQYSETLTKDEDNEYSFVMPRGNVTVSATFVYDPHEHDGITFSPAANTSTLSTAGSYYLTADTELPSALASGTTNICLNGNKLYIGDSGVALGQDVTLNIYDDQGTGSITAAAGSEPTNSAAITVDNGGTLNLFGGSITGFSADTNSFGGAVSVCSGGEFNMNDGSSIRKNSFNNNGGVFIQDGGSFTLCGNAEISDNTIVSDGTEKEVNVLLDNNAHINISAELDRVAAVGVSTISNADSVTITEGLNSSIDYFFSDNDELYIFTGSDGEAVLSRFEDGMGTTLKGYTVVLDGDIAVNFYMELASSVINSTNDPEMNFTVPGGGSEYEAQTVKLSDAEHNGNIYRFKCRVAAKNMTAQIQAQLSDGNNLSKVYTCSVKDYSDYLLAHADENGNDNEKEYYRASPLVRAMLHYGAAAQEQFGSTDPPANEGIEDNGWENVTAADINKPHSASNETLPQNIDFEGATLTLNSQTTLSLYFTSDEMPEFSCENMTVESFSVGSYKVASIRNIPAKKLSSDFILKVNKDYQVKYCPLTYCYNVLNETEGRYSDTLKNTVRTFYLYSSEADAYFPHE